MDKSSIIKSVYAERNGPARNSCFASNLSKQVKWHDYRWHSSWCTTFHGMDRVHCHNIKRGGPMTSEYETVTTTLTNSTISFGDAVSSYWTIIGEAVQGA